MRQQKQEQKQIGPIILNCLSGSERSGQLAIAVAAISATSCLSPILISKISLALVVQ